MRRNLNLCNNIVPRFEVPGRDASIFANGGLLMLPIDVVKKTMESIETGDMETTGIYLSEELVVNGMTPEPLDKNGFIELMTGMLDAVPNWFFNTRDIIERGNIVKVTTAIRGTHTGTLRIPVIGVSREEPTRRQFLLPDERFYFSVKSNKIYSIKVDRVRGGGIPGILRQLGIEMPVKVAV